MESLNMHVNNKYGNKGYVAPHPRNCFEVVFHVYWVSALTVGTHGRLKYALWILMHSGSSFITVVFEEALLKCLVVSVILAFFHKYENCCVSQLTWAFLSYSKLPIYWVTRSHSESRHLRQGLAVPIFALCTVFTCMESLKLSVTVMSRLWTEKEGHLLILPYIGMFKYKI